MRILLYILGVFFLCLSVFQIYDYISFKSNQEAIVLQKGEETTTELRDQIDNILARIAKEGKRLAEIFGSQELSKKEIEEIIKESSLSIKEIQGVTACYEPYSHTEKERLYCPYYDKGTGDYFFVGQKYDYSIAEAKGTAWYTGVRDNGAKWVEPYFGEGVQDWFVDFGIPFYFVDGPKKGQVRGTITMSFVCGGFKELVHSMSLGKTGFGIITSNENNFLAHPNSEYLGTTNLQEVIDSEKNENLREAFEQLQKKEKGYVRFFDKEVDDETFFYHDKIPTSGWGLGLVFYRNSLLQDGKILNRKYIKLALYLSMLFIVLLTIFYNRDHLDSGEIWTISALSTLVFLFNIIFIGYLEHGSAVTADNASPPIVDVSSLEKIISKQHAKADVLKTPKLRSVPTGIFINNLEFEDSYNVNVGGKVWQKYPLELADKVNIGFVMPQMSPFAEASYVEEISRTKMPAKEGEKGFLLVHWDIRVTLRLNLSYKDFPFDKRKINIEIIPVDNNDYLLFTPDLTSYKYTNPDKKSGLDSKISISGSEVLESYFNYTLETYDSDFGYGMKGLYEEVPVLHYNINLKRKLLNAFITYLVPIVVTLIMVFILITAIGKTEERQGIIESMAAFFFVLIFSHIDLRKEIETADLTYIEYFYFISYAMLILATYNMIAYSKSKSGVFDYEDNLLFKAGFIPLMLLATLVFTFLQFY